ncbi:hypothetical protein BDZ89DRAFT_1074985, partial [Hymenopellis radicata]
NLESIASLPSIGLGSSAFIALARHAPRNRQAFQKFSRILTRMSRAPIPSTTPEPTDDPDDPLNVIALVFEALTASIAAEFLRSSTLPGGSPYSEETNALVLKIMPYLSNCMSYFATHIIIPGREPEFRHNFAQLSATLLAGVADSAEIHFGVYREIISLPAPQELRSEGNTLFLSCILPVLLFDDTSSSPASREEVVFHCFRVLGCLVSVDFSLLPPQVKELYNAVKAETEALVDLFQSSVILNIGRLRAVNLQTSRPEYYRIINYLATAYRGIFFFFAVRGILCRLMDNDHVRWTCEMLCAISKSKQLRQFVVIAPLPMSFGKNSGAGLLTMSNACVDIGAKHLDRLIIVFGPAVAQQVFKEGAVLSTVRMLHLVTQAYLAKIIHASTIDNTVRETTIFLEHAFVYLVYRSVLKYAIRTEQQMKRFLTSELLATTSWKAYNKHLNDMTALYKLYQHHPVTICDGPECPNLDSPEPYPLRVCSGCAVYYYCSEACQKRAWEARHREICPSYQEAREFNINQAVTSRDNLFFCYIRREVMRAHVDADKSLVRHLDFSKFPPVVELRTIESYNTAGTPEHDQFRVPELPNNGGGVPMVTIMPLGDNDMKRVERYNDDMSRRGVIRYNPSV